MFTRHILIRLTQCTFNNLTDRNSEKINEKQQEQVIDDNFIIAVEKDQIDDDNFTVLVENSVILKKVQDQDDQENRHVYLPQRRLCPLCSLV